MAGRRTGTVHHILAARVMTADTLTKAAVPTRGDNPMTAVLTAPPEVRMVLTGDLALAEAERDEFREKWLDEVRHERATGRALVRTATERNTLLERAAAALALLDTADSLAVAENTVEGARLTKALRAALTRGKADQ